MMYITVDDIKNEVSLYYPIDNKNGNRMYTQKKNYILQLKVSRFHDHQAILQSKDQNYLLYCEIGGT